MMLIARAAGETESAWQSYGRRRRRVLACPNSKQYQDTGCARHEPPSSSCTFLTLLSTLTRTGGYTPCSRWLKVCNPPALHPNKFGYQKLASDDLRVRRRAVRRPHEDRAHRIGHGRLATQGFYPSSEVHGKSEKSRLKSSLKLSSAALRAAGGMRS